MAEVIPASSPTPRKGQIECGPISVITSRTTAIPTCSACCDCGHGSARDTIGELTRRQREERQRDELGQSDEAEVEGPVADRVDLPADRDHHHLRREAVREQRRPEQREAAHSQRGWEALPHERER